MALAPALRARSGGDFFFTGVGGEKFSTVVVGEPTMVRDCQWWVFELGHEHTSSYFGRRVAFGV